MKRPLIFAVLSMGFAAVAQAQHFRAWLTGYEEVPAVSSQADGIFEARVTNGGNAVEFELAYQGLQAPVQQAHIHFAQKSVNGPIVIWLCGTPAIPGPAGTQTCPASGSVFGTFTAANVLAAPAAQQLSAGELSELIRAMKAGVAYANIHTAASPGGEIRGQIRRSGHR